MIAFPKTQKGACPLTDAPAPVADAQLAELGLAVVPEPEPGPAAAVALLYWT